MSAHAMCSGKTRFAESAFSPIRLLPLLETNNRRRSSTLGIVEAALHTSYSGIPCSFPLPNLVIDDDNLSAPA